MRARNSTNISNSTVTCNFFSAVILLSALFHISKAIDTLNPGQILSVSEFLESKKSYFRLEFFSPSHTRNRYLAIRTTKYFQKEDSFNSEPRVIWIANREFPFSADTAGTSLNFTAEGYLAIIGDENEREFVINRQNPATNAKLLDSGNLVLKSGEKVIWQSFDHPTDTILPGMKIGIFSSKKVFVESWVSPQVPRKGAFRLGIDPVTKRIAVWRRGVPYWRDRKMNESDHGYFEDSGNFKFSYFSGENETYFSFSLPEFAYGLIAMKSNGGIDKVFVIIGSFTISGSPCKPRELYPKDDYRNGCVKPPETKCGGGEFEFVTGTRYLWDNLLLNNSMSLSDCEDLCRNNCSCKAYRSASYDGSGCRFSSGEVSGYGNEIESFYLRKPVPRNIKEKLKLILLVSILSLLLAVLCLCFFIWKKCIPKMKANRDNKRDQAGQETQDFLRELGTNIAAMDNRTAHNSLVKRKTNHELPLFGFSSIEIATEHFSEANKLGQGGFGLVFKGKLADGREIAVKRLSESSSQGIEEFKNEVVFISKVQHRNLVRLYGCCIKGEEKLLVYEYLPNKSLDTFLFDETKRLLLDWKLRMNIIEGIAQGLLYLHKYSRLKIIHRDLKTSNILLDNNMNPKISDFGMAKIFGEDETCGITNRIVGTYGYMSPEYAMEGLFSAKSDVFSFGVVMLEILSGKKNSGFYQSDQSLNLVRHASNLWKEEQTSELMDTVLAQTSSEEKFGRYVHIALLCVQGNAENRPNMSEVVSMLKNDTVILPQPEDSSLSTFIIDNSSGRTTDSSRQTL